MIYERYILQFSRNCARWAPVQKPSMNISSKFLKEFTTIHPKLIDSALEQTKYLRHKEVKGRIKKVSEYYPLLKVPLEGELLLFAYELLEKPENINKNMLDQAYALACLMEMFQAYFITLDDVLDEASMRSNIPCWHLLADSSSLAITDLIFLRSFIYEVVNQRVDKSFRAMAFDLFNETFLRLEISEHMDVEVQNSKNYNEFTMSIYDEIQINKASHYCLNLPVKLALVLSNRASGESLQLVEDLCNDLGVIVQINNDFIECRQDEWAGKSNTDIQCGKCSWVALSILQRCNAEQRKIFEENYGSWDPECVEQIQKLFSNFNVSKMYVDELQSRYDTFLRKANALPEDANPSPEFFRKVLAFFRSYVDDPSRYFYE